MSAKATKRLVERIEDERKKLEDISFAQLSQPDVIKRQQEFDKAVIEFMRKTGATGTGSGRPE